MKAIFLYWSEHYIEIIQANYIHTDAGDNAVKSIDHNCTSQLKSQLQFLQEEMLVSHISPYEESGLLTHTLKRKKKFKSPIACIL